MNDMVAALVLDFYGTVVHEDDTVIAAICAQMAATLTAPVPVSDIARQWSARPASPHRPPRVHVRPRRHERGREIL
jgi:hypothetical protein